jgi:hypothetical protein
MSPLSLIRRALIAWVAVGLISTTARAQVPSVPTDVPARPYRGVFGGNPANDVGLSQSLDSTISVASGIDSNAGTRRIDPGLGDPSAFVEGPYSVGDVALSYARRGREFSFGASASGSARYYSELQRVLNVGEAAGVGVEGRVGSRTRIQAQQRAAYTPQFTFNPFMPLAPPDLGQVEAPNADLTLGRQDSTTWGSSAEVSHVLGPHSTMAVGYGFDQSRFSADLADQRFQTVTLRADREMTSNRRIAGSYRWRDGEYNLTGAAAPVTTHETDFSFNQQWVHSPTRRTSLQVTAGGALVDSAGDRTLSGIGGVQLATMLGESWTIRSSFRRSVDPIPGVSVVTSTDSFGAGLGGLLSERFDLTVDAGLSQGDSLSSSSGRFRSYTGSVRLGFGLNTIVAVYSEVYYYHYDMAGPVVRASVGDWFSRSGLRVGVNLWAPLIRRRQQS